ncbi:uncharacterized protein METZ01_LOCUS301314, partial [marine metagenome]
VHGTCGELNETDIFCSETLQPVFGMKCYSQGSHFFWLLTGQVSTLESSLAQFYIRIHARRRYSLRRAS